MGGKRFALVGEPKSSSLVDGVEVDLTKLGMPSAFVTTVDAGSPASVDLFLKELDRRNLTFVFMVVKQSTLSVIAEEIEKRKMKVSIVAGFAQLGLLEETPIPDGIRAIVPMFPFSPQDMPLSTRKYMLPNYAFLSEAAGTVVAEALTMAQNQNRSISEVLATATFGTKLGPIKFNSEHERELAPYEVFEWHNGGWIRAHQ